MKVLLLGVGMQGKAPLYYLAYSNEVTQAVAADRDFDALKDHVERNQYGSNVRCAYVDAADPDSINRLMEQKLDVAIDLIPVAFNGSVVAAVIKHGIHLVNTN